MNGKAPNSTSKWYTEPLRRIANYVATAVVVIGAVVAVANEFTGLGFVSDHVRTEVTVAVGIATGVAAFLQKVQGWLARNGVPGVATFNGMASPETVHKAMVKSAQPAVLPTPADQDASLAALAEHMQANPHDAAPDA